MKKNWLIGFGIAGILGIGLCAGLGIFLFSGVIAMTQPVVDASEQFLALVGQGKIAEAYASTADRFHAQQDEASFTRAVKQLGLTDYASASWHNREIKNQEGTAEGTVTSKNGGTKPVSIQLVQEGGKWKVVGVRYGGVELVTIKAPPPMPPAAEVERMVTESLLDFHKAVQAKDFTAFYGTLSDLWKKETTPQQIQKVFQDFLDKNIDIGSIKNAKPQFAPPATVNDKSVLVVAGHYPTQPAQVRFELQYIHERDAWKLTSISVNVGKGNAPEK